jgi:SAM-dependent methyltransferase
MSKHQIAIHRGPPAAATAPRQARPWQLRMFSKGLKKRQKLRLILRQIGPLQGQDCLLVTNGDNNGALNYYLREQGGQWNWVELESAGIAEMEDLLGESVAKGEPEKLPCPDAAYDAVISIDVHEHLDGCEPFNRELVRVLRPGGRVLVTTPNGDGWKPLTVLKRAIGMTKERYGHRVIGYNVRQHRAMLEPLGVVYERSGSYSKFFTELIELGINFAYLALAGKRTDKSGTTPGIAPASGRQFRSVEKQYRLYSAVFPVCWLVSKLDLLLFPFTGYAVSVVCRRFE